MLIMASILLAVYLYYDCMANTGCSGESGIVFVLLGLPWSMYPSFRVLGFLGSVGVSILINIILLSFCFQCLSWIYHFLYRKIKSYKSVP